MSLDGRRGSAGPRTLCSIMQDFTNTHVLGALGVHVTGPSSAPSRNLSASSGDNDGSPGGVRSRPRPPALQRIQSLSNGSLSSPVSSVGSSDGSPLASPLATPSGKMRKDLKRSGSSRKIVAKERSPSSKEKSGSHLDVESPMDKDVRRDVRDIMKKIHDAQGRTAKEGICWKSVGDDFRSKSIRRPAMQ